MFRVIGNIQKDRLCVLLKELFVVKSKSKYSCPSALYFQLDKQTIKDNCIFDYYYNKTNVKPSIFYGGHEIVLAN